MQPQKKYEANKLKLSKDGLTKGRLRSVILNTGVAMEVYQDRIADFPLENIFFRHFRSIFIYWSL